MIKRAEKCSCCPFLGVRAQFQTLDHLLLKYPGFCSENKLEETEYGICCDNYNPYFDESTFEIVEIEVEE